MGGAMCRVDGFDVGDLCPDVVMTCGWSGLGTVHGVVVGQGGVRALQCQQDLNSSCCGKTCADVWLV